MRLPSLCTTEIQSTTAQCQVNPTNAITRILTSLLLVLAFLSQLGIASPAPSPEIAVELPVGMNIPDGGDQDFGTVVIGASANLTFTITNTGDADLNLMLPITFSGVDAALFTLIDPPATTPVLPGEITTFTVRFAPLASGKKVAALQIANNDSNEGIFDINLTGRAPLVPVNLGSTSGFAILSGAAITSTGGGVINGNVGASPIAGTAIGVTCAQVVGTIYAVDATGPPCAVIDATFLTTAKGDLTIAYNDAAGRVPVPSGPNLNPGLIPGSGNIGGMTLAPGLYKFTTTALIAGLDVTLMGGPKDVWIFQCAQDLQLASGIKVILAGGALASNIFWQVGTSAVLGTFSSFKGTILADQAITLQTSSTLEGRALASTAGVVFNGSGLTVPVAPVTIPEIVVEQPVGMDVADGGNKDFGAVLVGANKDLIFTIKNTGDADLNLTLPITFSGADADLFTVTVPPTTPVLPGGVTTFTVRFSPLTVGAKVAALQLANNDSNEDPFDISLSGTATPVPVPEIVVEQPVGTDVADDGSKDFGAVFVGANKDLIFTVKNTGDADLNLTLPITFSGADADLFTVTVPPTTPVLPGGVTTFTVRFSPLTVGAKVAALQLANNDSNEDPFDINLSGTSSLVPVPEIAIEQPVGTDVADGGSKDFGAVLVGANKDLIFTIKNTGDANLNLTLPITFSGADAGLFTVTVPPTTPVLPAGVTTFTVRFSPLTVGAKVAALQLANNRRASTILRHFVFVIKL